MIKIIYCGFTGFLPRWYKFGIPFKYIIWFAWWKVYFGIDRKNRKMALDHINEFKRVLRRK